MEGTHNSFTTDKSSIINSVVTGDSSSGILLAFGSLTGNVTILHSSITNNTVTLYGPPHDDETRGGLFLHANTVKIAETTFHNNSGGICGALNLNAYNIYITSSYFTNNSAVSYTGSGGAVCSYTTGSQMVISNSTFNQNYAKQFGGVIAIFDSDNVEISGSLFANNRAELQVGGVVWIDRLKFNFYISNSTFVMNQAGTDGGVMHMINNELNEHSQLVINGSFFNSNKANTRGGVFSTFDPCSYLINNSSLFTNNQAGTDGGVMYVGSSNSQVKINNGSMFGYNNATGRGGVISINDSRLEISSTTTFINNLAAIGDDIIACNCDISTAAFMLHSYTDPSFPNCTLYGYHDATTGSGINVKVVAMAVSIPVASIVIFVTLLTAIILVFMCFRRKGFQRQYGVRRSDHPDFVPLVNNP